MDGQKHFETQQKECPADPEKTEETLIHNTMTLFTPTRSATLEDFFTFFVSEGFKDSASEANQILEGVSERVKKAFKHDFEKEFNGSLIKVIHKTKEVEQEGKTSDLRGVLFTFQQDGEFYYAYDRGVKDFFTCKVEQTNEIRASNIVLEEYSVGNWFDYVSLPNEVKA